MKTQLLQDFQESGSAPAPPGPPAAPTSNSPPPTRRPAVWHGPGAQRADAGTAVQKADPGPLQRAPETSARGKGVAIEAWAERAAQARAPRPPAGESIVSDANARTRPQPPAPPRAPEAPPFAGRDAPPPPAYHAPPGASPEPPPEPSPEPPRAPELPPFASRHAPPPASDVRPEPPPGPPSDRPRAAEPPPFASRHAPPTPASDVPPEPPRAPELPPFASRHAPPSPASNVRPEPPPGPPPDRPRAAEPPPASDVRREPRPEPPAEPPAEPPPDPARAAEPPPFPGRQASPPFVQPDPSLGDPGTIPRPAQPDAQAAWLAARLREEAALRDAPAWSSVWRRRLVTWSIAGGLLAGVAAGGLWLYEENRDEGALVVVANEAPAGPTPAAQAFAAGAPAPKPAPVTPRPAVTTELVKPLPEPAVTTEPVKPLPEPAATTEPEKPLPEPAVTTKPVKPLPEPAAPVVGKATRSADTVDVAPPRRAQHAKKEVKKRTQANVRRPAAQDAPPATAAGSPRQRREETLMQCRAHGYDARQCVEHACTMTRYGFVCKG